MSARSNKIRSAHSRSGKRDKDSQPWWPVSSLSPACSGGARGPYSLPFVCAESCWCRAVCVEIWRSVPAPPDRKWSCAKKGSEVVFGFECGMNGAWPLALPGLSPAV